LLALLKRSFLESRATKSVPSRASTRQVAGVATRDARIDSSRRFVIPPDDKEGKTRADWMSSRRAFVTMRLRLVIAVAENMTSTATLYRRESEPSERKRRRGGANASLDACDEPTNDEQPSTTVLRRRPPPDAGPSD